MVTRFWVRACLLCVLLLLVRLNVFAQQQIDETTGTLVGTVTDLDGQAVPNALVSVIAASQSFTSFVDSDRSGGYSVADLPPGTYRVRIQADGFRDTVVYPVSVSVGHRETFDVHLKNGPVQSLRITEWKRPEQVQEHKLALLRPPPQETLLRNQPSPGLPGNQDKTQSEQFPPFAVPGDLIAYDPLLAQGGFDFARQPLLPFSVKPSNAAVPQRMSIEEHMRWKSAEELALADFSRQHPLAVPLRSSRQDSAVTQAALPETMAVTRTLNVPVFPEQSNQQTVQTTAAHNNMAVHSTVERRNWTWAKTTLSYFGKLGARLRRA